MLSQVARFHSLADYCSFDSYYYIVLSPCLCAFPMMRGNSPTSTEDIKNVSIRLYIAQKKKKTTVKNALKWWSGNILLEITMDH